MKWTFRAQSHEQHFHLLPWMVNLRLVRLFTSVFRLQLMWIPSCYFSFLFYFQTAHFLKLNFVYCNRVLNFSMKRIRGTNCKWLCSLQKGALKVTSHKSIEQEKKCSKIIKVLFHYTLTHTIRPNLWSGSSRHVIFL